MSNDVMNVLASTGLVPIVTIDDPGLSEELAGALLAGGIPCAEVTLRTPAGISAIRRLSSVSGFTVGAGTVLTVQELEASADAGARFIVSPGLDDEVVVRGLELGLAMLPGVATATEIQHSMRHGLTALKLFPVEQLGGPATIQALAGPFPHIRFMASGGVSASTARDYLSHPSVFAVGTSWIATRVAIHQRRFGDIQELAADAIAMSGRA